MASDKNPYHSGTLYRDGSGYEVLVDWLHTPGPSALAQWQHDSTHVGPTFKNYELISVRKADYRTYDAADWEYKRSWQGRQVHVLNRGMVTDPHHGYALLMVFPVDAWSSDKSVEIRKTFFATFKPAE